MNLITGKTEANGLIPLTEVGGNKHGGGYGNRGIMAGAIEPWLDQERVVPQDWGQEGVTPGSGDN